MNSLQNNHNKENSLSDSFSIYTDKEVVYLDKYLPIVGNAFDENELYDIIVKSDFNDDKIKEIINERLKLINVKGHDYAWNVVKKVKKEDSQKYDTNFADSNSKRVQHQFYGENYRKEKGRFNQKVQNEQAYTNENYFYNKYPRNNYYNYNNYYNNQYQNYYNYQDYRSYYRPKRRFLNFEEVHLDKVVNDKLPIIEVENKHNEIKEERIINNDIVKQSPKESTEEISNEVPNNADRLNDFSVDEVKVYFERLKVNNKKTDNNSKVNYISLLNNLKNDFCMYYTTGTKSNVEKKEKILKENTNSLTLEKQNFDLCLNSKKHIGDCSYLEHSCVASLQNSSYFVYKLSLSLNTKGSNKEDSEVLPYKDYQHYFNTPLEKPISSSSFNHHDPNTFYFPYSYYINAYDNYSNNAYNPMYMNYLSYYYYPQVNYSNYPFYVNNQSPYQYNNLNKK